MKTLVLETPGAFVTQHRPSLAPPELGEARVRIRRIGVCGTDLHAFKGDQPFFSYPRVLGHELGVEVLEVNGESSLEAGQYCTVEPYLACGQCGPCKQGKTNCCTELVVLGVHEDGGMCEEMNLPLDRLHASSSLPLEHLALVEPLCIGAHAVARAGIGARDHVAIVGAGPIGLATAQFALLAGAEPIIVEVSAHRKAFCEQFMDVKGCVDGAAGTEEALKEAFGGDLPDVVFDANGNANAMTKAFDLVASGGKLVFVGLVKDHISFYDPEFHRRELTLLSSRNATGSDFRYVIEMLEEGRINLTPWITHRASLDEVAESFPEWLDPESEVVKAMIDVD